MKMPFQVNLKPEPVVVLLLCLQLSFGLPLHFLAHDAHDTHDDDHQHQHLSSSLNGKHDCLSCQLLFSGGFGFTFQGITAPVMAHVASLGSVCVPLIFHLGFARPVARAPPWFN